MPAIWSIWLHKWVNGTETCWGTEILASKGSNTCVINIDWAKKDCGKQNESHLVLVYRDTLKNNGRKYAKERNESLPPKVGELHIKYYTTLVKSFKKFSLTIRWRKIKGQRESRREHHHQISDILSWFSQNNNKVKSFTVTKSKLHYT